MSMLHRPTRDDAGLTLVELVVVMAILPVILLLSGTALVNAMHLQNKQQARTNTQNANRIGWELFSRLLRQATYPQQGTSANSTIIQTADANTVVFTSRLGGTSTVKQYVFALVGTDLRWDSVDPTCGAGVCTYATPATTALRRVAIPGVRDNSVCPDPNNDGVIFHYRKRNPIDGSLGTPLTTPVVAGDLASIATVNVDLYTKSQLGADAPGCESLVGTVDLRNGNPQ